MVMKPESQQKVNKTMQVAKVNSGPMFVERVFKMPVISLAINVGYEQYDKLKSSNVTVGDVMTRAERWAVYLWQKVQPIVDKFQEPINKADKLACNTLDFVEGKLGTVMNHQQQAK